MCKCPNGYECPECMPVAHKHAALIKAWADNPSLKFQTRPSQTGKLYTEWTDIGEKELLQWIPTLEYRIKPEPKPDIVSNAIIKFEEAWKRPAVWCSWNTTCPEGYKHNLDKGLDVLRFTFDGDTGKLKSVEIVK